MQPVYIVAESFLQVARKSNVSVNNLALGIMSHGRPCAIMRRQFLFLDNRPRGHHSLNHGGSKGMSDWKRHLKTIKHLSEPSHLKGAVWG